MSTTQGSSAPEFDKLPAKPPIRHNSLHEKFSDPSYLSDEPGFQQRQATAAPSNFNFNNIFGFGKNAAGSSLHAIKTPHVETISHPELAFSPTEIGVWEIHKESNKKPGEAAEPGRGFFR